MLKQTKDATVVHVTRRQDILISVANPREGPKNAHLRGPHSLKKQEWGVHVTCQAPSHLSIRILPWLQRWLDFTMNCFLFAVMYHLRTFRVVQPSLLPNLDYFHHHQNRHPNAHWQPLSHSLYPRSLATNLLSVSMDVPTLAALYKWTTGLLLLLGCFEKCCYEHVCTNFAWIWFHFSWVCIPRSGNAALLVT